MAEGKEGDYQTSKEEIRPSERPETEWKNRYEQNDAKVGETEELKKISKEEYEERCQKITETLFSLTPVLVEKYTNGGYHHSGHGWPQLQRMSENFKKGEKVRGLATYHVDDPSELAHGLQFFIEGHGNYILGRTISQDLVKLLQDPGDVAFIELMKTKSRIDNAVDYYNYSEKYLGSADIDPKNPTIFREE